MAITERTILPLLQLYEMLDRHDAFYAKIALNIHITFRASIPEFKNTMVRISPALMVRHIYNQFGNMCECQGSLEMTIING